MSEALRSWVRDELHNIVGFTEKDTVNYFVALSQRARSTAQIIEALQDADVPINTKTQAFAEQLLRRGGSGASATQQSELKRREQEKARLARANERFSLVEQAPIKASKPEPKREKVATGKRMRQTTTDLGDDDVEMDEIERDQKERKEFEERLLKRDEAKTKNVAIKGMSREDMEEVAMRKSIAESNADDRKRKLEDLRRTARMKYLKEREVKKWNELEADLADENELFGNEKLSKVERVKNEIKNTIYEATRQQRQLSSHETHGYLIPEAEFDSEGRLDQRKEMDKLKARYHRQENEKEASFGQQEYDTEQISKHTYAFGAKKYIPKTPGEAPKTQEFDLLLDDTIDFVTEEVLAGDRGADDEDSMDEAKAQAKTLADVRKSLPIFEYRDSLLEAIEKYQVLVVQGETGSGKTTQIPQYLYEAGYCKDGKKIGCTQPRRVAAMSVAKRVSDEMGFRLGHEVGYSIRFEDCTSEKTLVKYMTDGMLLREFLGEPDLKSYSVIIIDEAHERTLHTDILFGLVKDIALFRPDLKLIISSATLDAQRFQNYFEGAPLFKIPGRRYPVSVFYTQSPEADYIDAAIVTTLQIHVTQPLGDILIFVTGQEEVEACADALTVRTRGLGNKIKELIIARIYSTLPSDLQTKIFEPTPPGSRKVIIATNIAETSLTIDGICYVIDCGFCKQKTYDPRTGMESLIVTPVSQASSQQRAGRAGRTAPGKCYRLFTKWAFYHELEENTIPEIQRTNLGSVVLMLKSLGIDDLLHFDFMDPPPAETLIRALEQLYALGALNDRGQLTKLGRRMAEFPLEPQLSKMLIASEQYGCSEEILTICAMLSVNNAIFYKPKDKATHADHAMRNFFQPFGDHLTLLNVYKQWEEADYSQAWCYENFVQHKSLVRAHDVRDQLVGLCERVEIPLQSNPDSEDIRKAITAGFFYHTARLSKGGLYKTTKHNQSVQIHPGSCLFKEPPKWVIYHELVFTTKEFMRQVIEIKPEWLVEIAPHFYKRTDIEEDTRKMPKTRGKSSEFTGKN
eukprot:TRINITY_DN5380_c0_g1_i1.p1 TRINITY_DN5380_c0_g1~~TRINITY_DN5380_c0_g1_i1.p1  ORF type:complete len:1028 (-),score=194.31 TRINITY_DN5380_c0_g1_i1:35-3118(-)